jgi:patatin-like phospholipase/acyl hydrolase
MTCFVAGSCYLCYIWCNLDPYWRTDIDNMVNQVLGEITFEDALSEVNLVAYDIKNRNLNFYSKANFDFETSPVYNITLSDAVAASVTNARYSKEKKLPDAYERTGK